MLDLKKFIEPSELKKLEDAINQKKVTKIRVNKGVLQDMYSIDKLNNHLNSNILVYPYVSLNNYDSTTCKYDLIERTTNKHFNALESRLSKKNILFRIAKGDTLVISYLQEFDEDIEILLDYFTSKFFSNCNANLYYSYKNTKGINLHFDLHDILAVQFHGKKSWTILKQKGDTSQRIEDSIKPKVHRLSKDDIQNIDTEEGDILFIPRGVWHHAQTKDASSLHIALSLNPMKTNDLIKHLLNNKLDNLGETNLYDISEKKIKKELKIVIDKLNEILEDYTEKDAQEILSFLSNENISIKLS